MRKKRESNRWFSHIEARAEMIGKETHAVMLKNDSGSREVFSKRLMLLKILTVTCLGIGAMFYGGRILGEGPEESAASERKRAMFLTKQNSVATQGIPPIDLSAPGRTETATFALG
jgi:hypothetical protein